MLKRNFVVCTVALVVGLQFVVHAETGSRALTVLPPEHQKAVDDQTGAELTYLTTDPAKDSNLYFHQRSWLSDGSMILFVSERASGGLMGYLTATGELIRIDGDGPRFEGMTAAGDRPAVLAARGDELVEVTFAVKLTDDPAKTRSEVTAHERTIAKIPPRSGAEVGENSDNKLVAIGGSWADSNKPGVMLVDETTGEARKICDIDPAIQYGGHLQWSHTDPNIMSFAAVSTRLWIIDIRNPEPKPIYKEAPGELVTHESWWVNDQLLFCGGTHPKPAQDADVKVMDTHTGVIRIVGAGAWWPDATAEELARVNWWHSDGSDDGRWVVADNWYGDIMLFEGKTTRPHLLTQNHRTYGKGDHPHVGFDRAGKQVVFTSSKLGNSNVCVATIPAPWQESNQ
jgi:hypothetical protein